MKKFKAVTKNLIANPQYCVAVTGRIFVMRFKTRMVVVIKMRNADEAASCVAYEYSKKENCLKTRWQR